MPVLARYSSALRATLRGSREYGCSGQRVVHEEVAGQRLPLAEGIDPGGGHVGQQRHVRLVDRLEAPDRRTVERHAAGEGLSVTGWPGR